MEQCGAGDTDKVERPGSVTTGQSCLRIISTYVLGSHVRNTSGVIYYGSTKGTLVN